MTVSFDRLFHHLLMVTPFPVSPSPPGFCDDLHLYQVSYGCNPTYLMLLPPGIGYDGLWYKPPAPPPPPC